MRADLAEGVRWLWGHRFFRACALLFSWTNLVYEALFLIMIVVGREQGLSAAEIGLLFAAFGVCSLLGSLAAPRIARLVSMRTLVIGSFWIQLGFVLFLVKPSVYVLLIGSIPMALLGPAVNAVVIGYRTAVVPDRLTGRVGGIARTIALCLAAFGPLTAGLLLHSFSARETVAIYAALMLLLAVLGTWNPSIRNAPSLSDLDDLPRRSRAARACARRLTAQAALASPSRSTSSERTGALAERRTRRLLATSAPIVSAAPPSSTAPGR